MEYFGKSNTASKETDKQTAAEKLNLKITNIQMDSYIEKQKMPTLKELSLSLKDDTEITYVTEKSKKLAEVEYDVPSTNPTSIYTKLNEYPYEFEIDENLRLASIDDVKIADSSNDELKGKIEDLEKAVKSLQSENVELKSKVETLENETILNKRVRLTNDSFTPLEIELPTTQQDKKYASILLKESVKDYKYMEIQIECKNANGMYWGNRTVFIATKDLQFNNSDTIDWTKPDINFSLVINWASNVTSAVECYLKNDKEIIIASGKTDNEMHKNIRIKSIYGIK